MGNKEYLKERREWLIKHHFCVDCKKQDARTLIGRARCYECQEKARIRKSGIKYTREERKEMGLCSICGEVAKDGFFVCEKCYAHLNKARIASHVNHRHLPKVDISDNPSMPREEWAKNGFCRTCGDKVMDGYKVCESCRQHLINISRKAKENVANNYWANSMSSFFCQTP